MTDMKECGTCGYPLLPEEREGLMEVRGKMLKPWLALTDEEILLTTKQFSIEGEVIGFARAVMAKLHEKNHEQPKPNQD